MCQILNVRAMTNETLQRRLESTLDMAAEAMALYGEQAEGSAMQAALMKDGVDRCEQAFQISREMDARGLPVPAPFVMRRPA